MKKLKAFVFVLLAANIAVIMLGQKYTDSRAMAMHANANTAQERPKEEGKDKVQKEAEEPAVKQAEEPAEAQLPQSITEPAAVPVDAPLPQSNTESVQAPAVTESVYSG